MAKSNRWTRWVLTESADPRVPLPWSRDLDLRHVAFQTVSPGAMPPAHPV